MTRGSSPDPESFLAGLVQQLRVFAEERGISPLDVHVRLTLIDGTETIVQGLRPTGPFGPQGWGMIESGRGRAHEAWVVREGSVVRATFTVAPVAAAPIGFHAESR